MTGVKLSDRLGSRCRAVIGARLLASILLLSIVFVSCSQPAPTSAPISPTPAPTPSPTPAAVVRNPLDVPTPVIGKPYPGKGVVTIVNLQEGWVEINHEPIEGLMPAMQMAWPIKPRKLMKSIRVGDKVEFTVIETGKGEIITAIKTVR